jgi:N-acetylglucosamine kinase-like BadF-type ATPase
MILIADSGSTKTAWCLVDENGRANKFETEGYNPCYSGSERLQDILTPNLSSDFDWINVKKVAFYGAGVYKEKYSQIHDALLSFFPNAQIEAAMDLMGSARALLNRDSGFAAILGTGSNSCLYDGKNIIHYIDSLGFMLGDEGSGGYMGKRLIGEYIRGYMPEDVRRMFRETYPFSHEELIENIYSSPVPNRYCASFTRFLTGEYAGHEYLEEHIIRDSFRDFFRNIVSHYPNYKEYSFNSVGTVGWIFKDRLTDVAKEFGMDSGNIILSPMDGLIKYHCFS